MLAPLRTRGGIFAAAVAFYLFGISVAVLTGITSALSVAIVLVAGATWAFGWRLGLAAVALEKAIEFTLFSTGAIPSSVPAAAIMVPAALTDGVVILALAALRAAEAQLRERNAELAATLAEVKELRGMLPICAWCKCVRDVNGMWNRLESYLAKHSRATLTHGVCPQCAAALAEEANSLPPTG
jgi:hypothetical protein